MKRIKAYLQRNKLISEYQALADQEAAQARDLRNLGRSNIRKGRGELGVKQIELSQEHQRQAKRYLHGVRVERSKRDK